jgi:hypothetical protein
MAGRHQSPVSSRHISMHNSGVACCALIIWSIRARQAVENVCGVMQDFAGPREERQAAADSMETQQSQDMIPMAQPETDTDASTRSGQAV